MPFRLLTMDSETGMVLKLSEIIKSQAVFNCGTAGHVSHGKSTLVCALTGTQTQRFQKEQEKNITIKLGYANCKLFINVNTGKVYAFPTQCSDPVDPETNEPLVHHSTISFVDCPGHELYMATMISGSTVMDHAVVVIAANEKIPRPQTHHHLYALDYSKVNDISFALNKLDLLKVNDVPVVKSNLDAYLKSMDVNGPIYPISAATGANVSELCQFLAHKVNLRMSKTISDSKLPLRMNIVRSYNVNRPNVNIKDMVGAVVGGTIQTGVLTVGDQVELRPGVIYNKGGRKVIQPLVGRVVSLESDKNVLHTAVPGGLIGVSLTLYAGLSNDDHLKGFVLGHVGTLPDMYDTITGSFRILDIRSPGDDSPLPSLSEGLKVDLVINGICVVPSEITGLKTKSSSASKGTVTLKLKVPAVIDDHSNIAIMIDRKLVAALKKQGGSMSLPIVYPDGVDSEWQPPIYTVVDDLVQAPHQPKSFETMVQGLSYRSKRIQKEVYVYPNVTKVNRSSLMSHDDLQSLVDSMTYGIGPNMTGEPVDLKQLLITNLGSEFPKSEPRFTGDGNLVMNAIIHKDRMVNFIDKFASKLLLCPSCKGTKSTLMRVPGRAVQRYCHNCPAVTSLHTTNIGQIA